MKTRTDEPIRERWLKAVVVALYRHRERDTDVDPEQAYHAEHAIRFVARLYTLLLEESLGPPWTVARRSVGYLTEPTSGFVVPWHLALDTSVAVLDQVAQVAERIRASARSNLCLSGSALLAESIPFVDDLDWCEYIQQPDTSLSAGLSRVVVDADQPPVLCMNVGLSHDLESKDGWKSWWRHDANVWSPAFRTDPLSEQGFSERLNGFIRGGLSFLVHGVFSQCPVRADSFMLADDPRNRDASFAFQEAPFRPEIVPRTLTSLPELGRYVDSLITDVKTMRHESQRRDSPDAAKADVDAAKLAKRLLALTRLTFLSAQATRILEVIERRSAAFALAFIERRNRLAQLARPMRACGAAWAEAHSRIEEYVANSLSERGVASGELESKAREATDVILADLGPLCDEILARVDEELSRISSNLAIST